MSDDILHHTNVRMRVTGTGNLDVRLIALYDDFTADAPPTETLAVIPMASGTEKLVQQHANFESQYTQVEISTDAIDEFFYITKITLYSKKVAVAYPM